MITQHQLENYELNHKRGGNGLYMIEDLDADHCRCVQVSGDTPFGSRAFLTAKDQLSVFKTPSKSGTMMDVPVPSEFVEPLQKLRSDIKAGKMAVFHTHIMSAERAKAMRTEH